MLREHYDYVIIGGGTAGSVLASRLSENSQATVLLLEQGPSDENASTESEILRRAPRMTLETWKNPSLARSIPTVPSCSSPTCKAPNALRGCGLGGTTNINGCFWSEPLKSDFDGWCIPGWSGDEMAHYLSRARFQLRVSQPGAQQTLSRAFLDLLRSSGVPTAEDLNQEGDMSRIRAPLVANSDGKRLTSFDAYVSPVLHLRRNLTVRTGVVVEGIQYNSAVGADQNIIASLVVYVFEGLRHVAVVTRELVLSCGVYESPKLLLLSGIGPESELRAMGVQVVRNLPGVGKNLVARPLGNILFSGPTMKHRGTPAKTSHNRKDSIPSMPKMPSARSVPSKAVTVKESSRWASFWAGPANHVRRVSGPFRSLPHAIVRTVVNTLYSGPPLLASAVYSVARPCVRALYAVPTLPEMDAVQLAAPETIDEFFTKGTGCYSMPVLGAWGSTNILPTSTSPDVFLSFTNVVPMFLSPLTPILGTCVTLAPSSRGHISLRSLDPSADPLVCLALFDHRTDLDPLVAAISLLRRVFSSAPCASTAPTAPKATGDQPELQSDMGRVVRLDAGFELLPGADMTGHADLAQYLQGAKDTFSYHAYGSCRMGTDADAMAVVDERLRVRGVRNLRVVDASVIPGRFSCGPMSVVYALAEKASEMILADNREGEVRPLGAGKMLERSTVEEAVDLDEVAVLHACW